MSDPFVAEIRIFGFNFAPSSWAFCNGQQMPINQNTALFSLLGLTYGGDGRTTFALPNLQGSAVCSPGQGAGLSNRVLGSTFGSPNVTLQTTQIPAHQHTFTTMYGSGAQERNDPVAGCHLARTLLQHDYSSSTTPNATLGPMIGATGGGQSHANMQPYLVMNFCIALQGQFPQRP